MEQLSEKIAALYFLYSSIFSNNLLFPFNSYNIARYPAF